LQKSPIKKTKFSAKETYNFKESTNHSHPILQFVTIAVTAFGRLLKIIGLIAKEPYKRDDILSVSAFSFCQLLFLFCVCLCRQQKPKTCLPMKTTHVDQQQQTEHMSTKFRKLNTCLQATETKQDEKAIYCMQ